MGRILRDITVVSGGQAVTWIATFVFVLSQARLLGPTRFGELSLGLSYAAFFAIVVDFGIATHVTRVVAEGRSPLRSVLWAALAARGGLWLGAMAVAWLLTIVLGYDGELQATILVLVDSILFVGAAGALCSLYQGRERFAIPALANALQRVAAAIVGIAALVAGVGVVGIAAVYAVSAALAVTVLLVGLRGTGVGTPQFDRRAVSGLLRASLPIGLYWIVGTFYFNVDMALMERLAPRDSLGHYAAAYRLFNALTIVPAIVCGTVLYPVYARLSTSSLTALRPAVERTTSYLVLVGALVAVLCASLATPIIGVLYPLPDYAPAASALRLLAPGLLFLYVNSVLSWTLFALHQERRLLVIAACAAVLNLSANLVAIPVFGPDGAAAVTSATELFLFGALLAAAPRGLLHTESVHTAIRVAGAAAVTLLLMVPLASGPLVVSGFLGTAAFVGAAIAFRAVPPNDLRMVVALARSRAGVLGARTG